MSLLCAIIFLSIALIYAIIMLVFTCKGNGRRNRENIDDSNFVSISEYTDSEVYDTDQTQSSVSYYDLLEIDRSKDTMSNSSID